MRSVRPNRAGRRVVETPNNGISDLLKMPSASVVGRAARRCSDAAFFRDRLGDSRPIDAGALARDRLSQMPLQHAQNRH